MRKSDFVLPETERQPTPEQNIDYSPKAYSLSEQVLMGVKFVAATGFLGFTIWLLDLIF
ncbi:hypothetical protein SAMN05660420_02244 [Desulfuromusa kysingii]|uniref:Uncharacterized protein n=1 Tax=Desulfuromusa kysingii TaxID=37625 RepID=A0A1H4BJL5_9BACT|nr:hypothetical protein [Desulfuromusa kysingii]SEA48339.1 hypothetical protein SAMN05660420_02244 [Desulfuromusa kysingii]